MHSLLRLPWQEHGYGLTLAFQVYSIWKNTSTVVLLTTHALCWRACYLRMSLNGIAL